MKTAIVCDWLTNMGGAEKVILALHRMFPKAPIYTTLYDPRRVMGFDRADIRTSFLQRIPLAQKYHPLFLGLMPLAIESFNLSEYDLVISSSHAVAKGVITKPSTKHLCYCHTPMRYAWEPWEAKHRMRRFPTFLHRGISKRLHRLRLWDQLSSSRVDRFIANSTYISDRIEKYYRREAEVIHPPVEVERFRIGNPQEYYLTVGRLIGYKRYDLAIQACNVLRKPLKVVGEGPELTRLKKIAGPTVDFLGRVADDQMVELYSGCRALIFPQIEDFGIAPVECLASGRPVIAFDGGGARDTVGKGEGGILFQEQEVENLVAAMRSCEARSWDSELLRGIARGFSTERFEQQLQACINSL